MQHSPGRAEEPQDTVPGYPVKKMGRVGILRIVHRLCWEDHLWENFKDALKPVTVCDSTAFQQPALPTSASFTLQVRGTPHSNPYTLIFITTSASQVYSFPLAADTDHYKLSSNNTHLFSSSSEGQKSRFSLSEIQCRCRQGGFPWRLQGRVWFLSSLAPRGHLNSLAGGPFLISFQSLLPTSSLDFLLISFQSLRPTSSLDFLTSLS